MAGARPTGAKPSGGKKPDDEKDDAKKNATEDKTGGAGGGKGGGFGDFAKKVGASAAKGAGSAVKGAASKLVPNFLKKIWNAIRWFFKAIRSGIGIIVLKVLLVVILLINIYIIAYGILDGISKWLGIELGPDDQEAARNLEYMAELNNTGLESMLSSEQMSKYYSYEYYCLMDCAEYMEEIGVTPVHITDSGKIDYDNIEDEDWALLVANAFSASPMSLDSMSFSKANQAASSASGGSEEATEVSSVAGGGSGNAAPPPSGEFYYRIMRNSYTGNVSLQPFFRIKRSDYDLKYFFEIRPSNGGTSDLEGLPASDQVGLAKQGKKYTFDTNGGEGGFLNHFGVDNVGRFIGFAHLKNGQTDVGAAAGFIAEYVHPLKFNSRLNSFNQAGKGGGEDRQLKTGDRIDLNEIYTEDDLYYSEKNEQVVYEVPLRSLLDRFLPNISLLSSWRLLTSEPDSPDAQDIVNDIMNVYDEACMSGERVETGLWLVKDVYSVGGKYGQSSKVSDVIDYMYPTLQQKLDHYYGNSGDAYLIKNENDAHLLTESYFPLYDTRPNDYKSKQYEDTKIAEKQTFGGGSLVDDLVDDYKLMLSQHAYNMDKDYSNSFLQNWGHTLSAKVQDYINEQSLRATSSSSSEVEETSSSDSEDEETPDDISSMEDLRDYMDDELMQEDITFTKEIYDCIGIGVNNSPKDSLRDHYGINIGIPDSSIEVKEEIDEQTGATIKKVYVNGNEVEHSANHPECQVCLVKFNYVVKDGLKTSACIFYDSGDYYAYEVKSKDQKQFGSYEDNGDRGYSNKYTFAHLESGDLHSTTFREWEFTVEGAESFESWFITDAFEGLSYDVSNSGLTLYVRFHKADGSVISDHVDLGQEDVATGSNFNMYTFYEKLLGRSIPEGSILGPGNFAIIRDTGLSYGGDTGQIDSRKEFYESDEAGNDLLIPPTNAFLSGEVLADIIDNRDGCSLTDEAGETTITQKAYLSLKKAGIKVEDPISINLEAANEYMTSIASNNPDYSKIVTAVKGLVGGKYKDELIHDDNIEQLDIASYEGKDPAGREWSWSYEVKMGVNLNVDLSVVFPVRVAVAPISQIVIDKEMPAYFVKDAKYWAAEKEFNNTVDAVGQFKDHNQWHYLIPNNSDAKGIQNIKSQYSRIQWRCELFAPLFGSDRDDSHRREDDVKLILEEWENYANSGLTSADHAIRDLNRLIQYSKGVKDFDAMYKREVENGRTDTSWDVGEDGVDIEETKEMETIWAKSGDVVFEPIGGKDDPCVNYYAFLYLYIPDEIVNFNELNCEPAFWLDRIISTRDRVDRIYDRATANGRDVKDEGKMRSRLPTFTWQVVDYNLYEETKVSESSGKHAVYALWPFGDQASRMLYAMESNADEKEQSTVIGWGGTSASHKAADLYGRTAATTIYQSVYNNNISIIASNKRNMVNEFYGFGAFNYGASGTPAIRAIYVDELHDAVLYFPKDEKYKPEVKVHGSDVYVDGVNVGKEIKQEDAGLLEIEAVDVDNLVYEEVTNGGNIDSDNGGLNVNIAIQGKNGNGIYRSNNPITLKLGKITYTFNGPGPATYAYLLYRQTLVSKDGERAEKLLKAQLQKEMQWTEVRAVAPGIVKHVAGDAVSGFYVRVEHSKDQSHYAATTYCHMKRYPVVQEGQYVGAGTILGYEGNTGRSKGPHVHLIVYEGVHDVSKAKQPIVYLYPFFTPFWYQEKAEEAFKDANAKNNGIILDSEYYSPARTVFPYGLRFSSKPSYMDMDDVPYRVPDELRTQDTSVGADPSDGGRIKVANVQYDSENQQLKIQNYYPTNALVEDADYLYQYEDGLNLKDPLVEPFIDIHGDTPHYSGEKLGSHPEFNDKTFQKKVMRNTSRIHGRFPGVMQYYAFGDRNGQFKTYVWNELTAYYNEYAAAGIMGNIECESGFDIYSLTPSASNDLSAAQKADPRWHIGTEEGNHKDGIELWKFYTHLMINDDPADMVYGKHKVAYGLCQWLSTRSRDLIELMVQEGLDENSDKADIEDVHIQFMIGELETRYYHESEANQYTVNPTTGDQHYYENLDNLKYNGKKIDSKMRLTDMLNDEDLLLLMGKYCYEHHEDKYYGSFKDAIKPGAEWSCGGTSGTFANQNYQQYYDEATGTLSDEALKTIGACEIILHSFEIPDNCPNGTTYKGVKGNGGQMVKGQVKRSNSSLYYLHEYGT